MPASTPPNDIVVHIRMLDRTAQLQQEAVGVLGINLMHAAFYGGDDTAAIIGRLLDELSRTRIEARALGGGLRCSQEHSPPSFRPFLTSQKLLFP